MAKRSAHFGRLVEVIAKMLGMHGDHCAKEKKTAQMMANEKTEATQELLGEDIIGGKTLAEIEGLIAEERSKVVDELGGQKFWDILSAAEKAEKEAVIMRNVLIAFGEEEYNSLPKEEQQILDFFVWVGCGCHKDANTVKGGYAALVEHWKKSGLPGPVLLANKDNAVVLAEIENVKSDDLTPAQARAILVTACGAIRATTIAGFIFNHKDDKKGQQDTFRFWFLSKGIPLNFPDTSNTRYGSHCEAAAVLIQYLKLFLEFLDFVRDKKDKRIFTHMEANLKKALECPFTLTEFSVLTLYSQAITHPYMRRIRGPGTENLNMLEAGPLHKDVQKHIEKVIENPNLLLSKDTTYETGSMDGKEWERPGAVKAVLEMSPSLPHLKDALVAFFKGALETWKRFTSEFDSDGLIDNASAHQRELAWMPATNDMNEGVLGSFRVFMRNKPRTTLHQFNAQAMYARNDTQDFMNKMFNDDDHAFVRRAARTMDTSKLEPKRRKALIEHSEMEVEHKRQRDQKKAQKAAEKHARVSRVELILDKHAIGNLKGAKLQDQYDAFALAGAPLPKTKAEVRLVSDKKKALLAAVDCLEDGTWTPTTILHDETSDSDPGLEPLYEQDEQSEQDE